MTQACVYLLVLSSCSQNSSHKNTTSVHPLLEIDHSRVTGTTLGRHVVLTPGAFNHGSDGTRDAQQLILDHGVRLSHAFVELRGHIMIELAVAALDKHLGDRGDPLFCHRHRIPRLNPSLGLHMLGYGREWRPTLR